MVEKLSDSAIQEHLSNVPGWSLDEAKGQITRTYEFSTFPAAIVFVSAVGHLAERLQHHPDILVTYNKVRLSVNTHDVGGISEKDFALAALIDAALIG
jgi:4a-hydroxytetrahydrobiopterin dehydratase